MPAEMNGAGLSALMSSNHPSKLKNNCSDYFLAVVGLQTLIKSGLAIKIKVSLTKRLSQQKAFINCQAPFLIARIYFNA